MIFRNNTIGNENINIGIKLAADYFKENSDLITEIISHDHWKYNTPKMPKLKEMLLAESETINVFTYKPKWRFSKAISYYQENAVYYNIYKLPSLLPYEIAASLVHERLHQLGFGHGNNFKTKDKVKHSIPYFASEYILNWYKDYFKRSKV